ncbi:uncharacterized protein LOC118433394 [Folsomia candida]|uniref:uncharacterized protein LOC118433394 n=1 Tax=Folsomia candida TaxID=158441 RepID=UPI001604C6DD|nr:uncharacterized protein LOC118433394 [Folsomia candida]
MDQPTPSQDRPPPSPPETKNPCVCFGTTLSDGVRGTAIVLIVTNALLALLYIFLGSQIFKPVLTQAIAFLVLAIICVIMLITDIVLLIGVNKRRIGHCKTWLISNIFLDISYFGCSTYQIVDSGKYYWMMIVLLWVLLHVTLLYAVYCFIQEIRQYPLGIPAEIEGEDAEEPANSNVNSSQALFAQSQKTGSQNGNNANTRTSVEFGVN